MRAATAAPASRSTSAAPPSTGWRRALGWLSLWAAMAALPQPAAAAGVPRLVVVHSQGRGAPNLRPTMVQRLEAPLRRNVELLSYRAYRRAARAAGVRPFALDGPEAAVLGGRGVGATHVLIVHSSADRGVDARRRPTTVYSAAL
ncbi:MAG: hypothetical protein EOO40_01460, partial [Deltaproteobacteria bacterium]